MSDNTEKPDSDTSYDPNDTCFDKETRSMLSKKLRKAIAFKGRLTSSDDIDSEVNELIHLMELASELKNKIQKCMPERQQRRKERIKSISNHLDGIIEQMRMLDYDAHMHILSSVCSEWPESKEELTPELLKYRVLEVCSGIFRKGGASALSLGVKKAAETLPTYRRASLFEETTNFMSVFPRPELFLAVDLENLFHEYGLDFTVTNTGLAADCLRAMYYLGGFQIDRVDYWLIKARDDELSSKNYHRRCKNVP